MPTKALRERVGRKVGRWVGVTAHQRAGQHHKREEEEKEMHGS